MSDINMPADCGTFNSYRRGCRCEQCRAANNRHHKAARDRRARLVAERVETLSLTHGLASTYANWGCRCEPCSNAHKDKMARDRESRLRRTREGVGDVPHGKNGYKSWGCRCEVCVTAAQDELRERAESAGRKFRPGLPGPAPLDYEHGAIQRYWQGCRCRHCLNAGNEYKKAHTNLENRKTWESAWRKRANDRTRDTANRIGHEWTGPELEIASRPDLTAKQVAEMLGRTIYAVHNKRQQLTRDPRAAALAGTELPPRPVVRFSPGLICELARQWESE